MPRRAAAWAPPRSARLLLLLLLPAVLLVAPPVADAARRKKKKGKVTKASRSVAASGTDQYISLRLAVARGAEQATLDDVDRLIAAAKADPDFQSDQLLITLRSASQKLQSALRDAAKREAREAARKAKMKAKWGDERTDDAAAAAAAAGPVFTDGKRRTRELKASMSSPKCNMAEYKTADELATAFQNAAVDLEAPFIVRGATDDFERLQKEWTSDKLRGKKFKDVRVRYLEPKMARVAMQQGGQAKLAGENENGQAMEVFDPKMLNFADYFGECFSHTKKPGPDTEHCEQDINALRLGRDAMGQFTLAAFEEVGFRQDLDSSMYKALFAAADDGSLSALMGGDAAAAGRLVDAMEQTSSRRIVFGPSGSGSSMRQEGMPFADALVHGKRRWFFLTAESFMALKRAAGDDFQPGSAFGFFEDMYAELGEDFDMNVGEDAGIHECDQNPGDVVYVPAGIVRTSLTLKDSISYKQELLTNLDQVGQYVEQRVWSPMRQTWNAALCFADAEVPLRNQQDFGGKIDAELGGLEQLGMNGLFLQKAFVEQLFSDGNGQAKKADLLLQAALVCHSAKKFMGHTRCGKLAAPCADKVHQMAKMVGVQKEVTQWLGPAPEGGAAEGGAAGGRTRKKKTQKSRSSSKKSKKSRTEM